MSSSRHVIVGGFLLGGMLLFAVGLFWIGDRRLLFDKHIVLQAEFYNLSGLKKGAKVRVSGLDAGEVLEIAVPPGPQQKFRVRFRVLDRFRSVLRTDSVATIQTEGLVGSMILRVDAGSTAAAEVTDGSMIASREPIELSDMVQQASETVDNLNEAIDDVREGIDDSLQKVTGISTEANRLLSEVRVGLERFVSTGNKVADDVEAIVARAKEGEGTVGKLLTDDRLYQNFTGTLSDVQNAAGNMRQATEEAKRILSELKSGGVVDDLEGTVANVRELTQQAKELLADLKPETGDGGESLVAGLRESVANAQEATSDLAENTEAIKRNFLLRGYFKDRGFYDLDELSVEEYRRGSFAPKRDRRRTWIHEGDIFTSSPDGKRSLSKQGTDKLDTVIAEYLTHAPNTPLIVEGYAAGGTESERFLKSRERASQVRDYLIEKYGLKPNYVGLMPMGTGKPEASGSENWEGVAIIFFPEKQKGKASSDLRMPPRQNGFRPTIGGLPTDSGFAVGMDFQETDLLQGVVDVGVITKVSFKRYLHGELHVDLPRLWNEHLFLETTTRFRNYPEENFFGIGPDSAKDDRVDFRLEDVAFRVDFGVRPSRHTRAGISAGFLSANTGPGKDTDFPSIEAIFAVDRVPGLTRQSDYLHAGAFVGYDSRDNPRYPRSGGSYQFRWTYFDDRNFGSFSFRRFDIDLRHFFPVRERGTIAVRGLMTLTGANPDQRAPFFLLPTVGGGDSLRGFQQYRFRDDNALLLNLEYRHEVLPVLDLVAFGDAGKVFPNSGELALSQLEGSAGLGGRLKLAARVFLGLDVGWSREGMRLWVRGSHTF